MPESRRGQEGSQTAQILKASGPKMTPQCLKKYQPRALEGVGGSLLMQATW